MEKIKIFACPTAEKFTQEICDCLGIEMGKINQATYANIMRHQDLHISQAA